MERNGDHAAFIAACGSYGSSRWGHGDEGARGFRGGSDYRGGGHIGGHGPRKCTHWVVVTILWIFVRIYMAHHLRLPIKLLLTRILQPHLDHLLV